MWPSRPSRSRRHPEGLRRLSGSHCQLLMRLVRDVRPLQILPDHRVVFFCGQRSRAHTSRTVRRRSGRCAPLTTTSRHRGIVEIVRTESTPRCCRHMQDGCALLEYGESGPVSARFGGVFEHFSSRVRRRSVSSTTPSSTRKTAKATRAENRAPRLCCVVKFKRALNDYLFPEVLRCSQANLCLEVPSSASASGSGRQRISCDHCPEAIDQITSVQGPHHWHHAHHRE
jgi:hypothetical protein